jgi:AcrR family transcriptional regulator
MTRRTRRRDGEQTRQRVIRAAIDTILDVGYYDASSNAIARRAGVTWGVIQHQFGTREALLLDVLHDVNARLHLVVAEADVSGDTLEARLAAVLDVLALHYGHPEHLVTMQIGLDLGQNPNTSATTRRAVRRHGEQLARAWQPLWHEALGDLADEPEMVSYAFSTIRGYLVAELVARSFGRARPDAGERRLLVEGVAASLRAEADRRGLSWGRACPR